MKEKLNILFYKYIMKYIIKYDVLIDYLKNTKNKENCLNILLNKQKYFIYQYSFDFYQECFLNYYILFETRTFEEIKQMVNCQIFIKHKPFKSDIAIIYNFIYKFKDNLSKSEYVMYYNKMVEFFLMINKEKINKEKINNQIIFDFIKNKY